MWYTNSRARIEHAAQRAHTNITTKQRTQLKTNATNYFNEAQFFPLLCASTSAF